MPLKCLKSSSQCHPFPFSNGVFVLDTDASNNNAGAVLSQQQEGQEHVLEYYSKLFNAAEPNYCVTSRELLAVVLPLSISITTYMAGNSCCARGPLVPPIADGCSTTRSLN